MFKVRDESLGRLKKIRILEKKTHGVQGQAEWGAGRAKRRKEIWRF